MSRLMPSATRIVASVLLVAVAASCRDPSAISENTPHQRGGLAWLDEDGKLVVSFFVGCDVRAFTSLEVSRDGEVAWTATASGTPPSTVEFVVVGSPPDGFTGVTFNQALLDEITAPTYDGQFAVSFAALDGETYGSGISLAERDHLAEDVVIWRGQLTRRSAVDCP